MTIESRALLKPFILSWNLRNTLENPSTHFTNEFCIIGTSLGEYPIDAWKTLYLEIPKDKHKKDITGRCGHAHSGLERTKWDYKRVIAFPLYTHSKESNTTKLKTLIKHWNDICIPDDIPCIALAVKCNGLNSDLRESQYVTVLVVWNDAVAQIISLDWFEGPLEDCVTPEWYIRATKLLSLKEAIDNFQCIYENVSWDNISFSMYPIPSCLGHSMIGETSKTSYRLWKHEWKYSIYTELKSDLDLVLSKINMLFINGGK